MYGYIAYITMYRNVLYIICSLSGHKNLYTLLATATMELHENPCCYKWNVNIKSNYSLVNIVIEDLHS